MHHPVTLGGPRRLYSMDGREHLGGTCRTVDRDPSLEGFRYRRRRRSRQPVASPTNRYGAARRSLCPGCRLARVFRDVAGCLRTDARDDAESKSAPGAFGHSLQRTLPDRHHAMGSTHTRRQEPQSAHVLGSRRDDDLARRSSDSGRVTKAAAFSRKRRNCLVTAITNIRDHLVRWVSRRTRGRRRTKSLVIARQDCAS
jgi:hypothetical protein